MNEKGNKKREWIKTAAIIFLSVMLVLTFFSNTIMNYSLPEVATQYVTSGSITAKIRGTGVIESGDPYEVEIKESRKVESVAVKVGDEVQKGDILLYLEEKESEELKAAQKNLEAAQEGLVTAQEGVRDARDAYYAAILTGEISAEDIQAANGNVSVNAYRQQITDAQNVVIPLEDKVAALEKQIADVDAQLALEGGLDQAAEDRVLRAKKALETATNSLTAAETAFSNAGKALEAAKKEKETAVSNGDASASAAADEKINKAQEAYNTAKTNRDNAQAAKNSAQTDYNNAVANQTNREGSQTQANLEAIRASLEVEKHGVENDLAAAQKKLDDLLTVVSDKLKLDGFEKGIAVAQRDVDAAQKVVDEAQAEVDRLAADATGTTVTADIAGTVTAVNIVAGNTTMPDSPLVVMQPEGKGYTLSFSVTNEQARKVNPGDRAELVNSWRYDDVDVVLASVKPDPNNPGQNKLLTFDVSGAVMAGQTLSLSVGQQSANFDLIVPNSAIREDNNGKFILIVESRSTPLGNRYSASRVDVEILASDDTQSAISAALYGYEYVITTSTQPVEAGQLVRLADN